MSNKEKAIEFLEKSLKAYKDKIYDPREIEKQEILKKLHLEDPEEKERMIEDIKELVEELKQG